MMRERSLISAARGIHSSEIGESSSSRQMIINHATQNIFISTSKYKGVVSQPNGHWGAQIYANHQRIWLGTFKSEIDAAMAYDSAVVKLRDGLSPKNFPWTNITAREANFQSQFSTEMVLSMIKDGSYPAKFSQYLRAQEQQAHSLAALNSILGVKLRQLFHKELTPSDVSKLNRLVIPKKFALKYFPHVDEENGSRVEDIVELVFFDRLMTAWNFRYCYWKSSQSFVFTRGWNKFVRDKGLKSRDRVVFLAYESNDRKLCIIDVEYGNHETGGGVKLARMDVDAEENDAKEIVPNCAAHQNGGFKLFGVQIV